MPRLYESICKERLRVKGIACGIYNDFCRAKEGTCLLMSIKKHCGTKDLLPAAQIENGSEEPLMKSSSCNVAHEH